MTNDERYEKLKAASLLLADVQIEMCKEDESLSETKRTENWMWLYNIRCDLNQEIFRLHNRGI